MINTMNKHFLSKKLLGKYVNLREITLDDAQFVLDLRCDSNKSKFYIKQRIILISKLITLKVTSKKSMNGIL